MLFPLASRILYILGRSPTYSAIGRIRLSSFQASSRSQCCKVGGLSGSSTCRRGPHAYHVLVHIIGLDFEEQRVRIGVQ